MKAVDLVDESGKMKAESKVAAKDVNLAECLAGLKVGLKVAWKAEYSAVMKAAYLVACSAGC